MQKMGWIIHPGWPMASSIKAAGKRARCLDEGLLHSLYKCTKDLSPARKPERSQGAAAKRLEWKADTGETDRY